MRDKLNYLLSHGFEVEVYRGVLSVIHPKGYRLEDEWHNRHAPYIISDLGRLLGKKVFRYEGYKTGRFRQGTSPGVLLRYTELVTGEEAYAIFNANLTRIRSTAKAKAGEPLPKKRFLIGAGHGLYKTWLRLGLPGPRRMSEMYKIMGRLKPVFLTAVTDDRGKILNSSINPLNLEAEKVKELLGDKLVAGKGQEWDKGVANFSGNSSRQWTVAGDGGKQLATATSTKGTKRDFKCVTNNVSDIYSTRNVSTSPSGYELSNQVMKVKEDTHRANKKAPQDQTIEEWIKDWDEAG